MIDDDLPGAFHMAILDAKGAALAVATLSPQEPYFSAPTPTWRLRQMASRPDCRGQGLGTFLFRAAVDRVRSRGGQSLWAESRDTALEFYIGVGMQMVPGRQHIDNGVSYTDVLLKLVQSPMNLN
jgi:GNAT superfamily N-acetyltransferase